MSEYKSPFYLKKLKLPSNIFYAPLAGFTDFPYRKMSSLYSPGLQYCEMVKMEPLIRRDKNTLRILDYEESMRPIGAQVCGSDVKLAAASAKMVEELGFDVIDLNCGCPVDRITKDGSGSGMLKNPEKIGEILAEMVAAVSIPVTVKIRAGWDENQINAPEITRIAEKAGASLIGVHGRTREQAYRGKSDLQVIKECKDAASSILVFGNGDLFTEEDVKQMFTATGCDGVLVSRGTMGQPWIAENIKRLYQQNELMDASLSFRKKALKMHFAFVTTYQNEVKAILDMRRIGCLYVKSFEGVKEFRRRFNTAKSLALMKEIIEELPECMS